MLITEVHIQPASLSSRDSEKFLGYASVVFDSSFLVRELRIVRNMSGKVFVAMPSRKLAERCPCGTSNHLLARYCNGCGQRIQGHSPPPAGPAQLYADLAFPITPECRAHIHQTVIAQLHRKLQEPRQLPTL